MASRYRFFANWGRSSKKPIDIQYVAKEKYPEAVGFMKRNYLDDPLMRSMGISQRHEETQRFLSALWLALLRSEMSLAAVHRNKICGLCINSPHTQIGGPPNDILLRLSDMVKEEGTRNLLRSWDKIDREAPLPTGKTPDGQKKRIMELAGLAVAFDYRRLGIAKKLVENSARLAMLLGFEYVRVDCTNPVTAKICEKLGWEKIWEMPFEKFEGVIPGTLLINEKDNQKVKVYLQSVRPTADSS